MADGKNSLVEMEGSGWDWSPQGIGLAPDRYAAALRHLFERPVPGPQENEWYWNCDDPGFDASPLEWVRIQTVLFANSGTDLAPFNDDQVGMGLNYVMNNAISNVPYAASDPSVPIGESLHMLQAMPFLWRDCFGRRLANLERPIGDVAGPLAFVCYMWFDVWAASSNLRHEPSWRDALWQVFCEMLRVPCREVQVAALHGVGHEGRFLKPQRLIDRVVGEFVRGCDPADAELKAYAEAARRGNVQ